MKFKDIEEGKLYRNKNFNNTYSKFDGLLYHVGAIYDGRMYLDIYPTEYKPEFVLGMDFKEIEFMREDVSE